MDFGHKDHQGHHSDKKDGPEPEIFPTKKEMVAALEYLRKEVIGHTDEFDKHITLTL